MVYYFTLRVRDHTPEAIMKTGNFPVHLVKNTGVYWPWGGMQGGSRKPGPTVALDTTYTV